jgi:hypothetical protein
VQERRAQLLGIWDITDQLEEPLREARRTTQLPAPVHERGRARCASVGGRAEECRSDERNGWASGTSLTSSRSRCARRDERLSFQRPCASATQQMGEAPVKYELTGASCHCANRSSRCGVDQLYASRGPLAIGCTAFFRHRRVTWN